jgi:hypothetical protein
LSLADLPNEWSLGLSGKRAALCCTALLGLVVTIACASAVRASGGKTVIVVSAKSAKIGTYAPDRNPTLAAAIKAFGRPSSCAPVRNLSSFASVHWRTLGLRMVFGAYAARPAGVTPCEATRALRLDSAYASGREWETSRSLRGGDSVARLRELYPVAFFRQYTRGVQRLSGWWLVVRSSRVPDSHRFPALLARTKSGRVTEFVVTLAAEGS